MHIVLWILLCLFASIGAVHAYSWLVCGFDRPKGIGRAYRVVRLEHEPTRLENQLYYEIRLLQWGSSAGYTPHILLDTGLDEKCKQICQSLLSELGMAIICDPDELMAIIAKDSAAQSGDKP